MRPKRRKLKHREHINKFTVVNQNMQSTQDDATSLTVTYNQLHKYQYQNTSCAEVYAQVPCTVEENNAAYGLSLHSASAGWSNLVILVSVLCIPRLAPPSTPTPLAAPTASVWLPQHSRMLHVMVKIEGIMQEERKRRIVVLITKMGLNCLQVQNQERGFFSSIFRHLGIKLNRWRFNISSLDILSIELSF